MIRERTTLILYLVVLIVSLWFVYKTLYSTLLFALYSATVKSMVDGNYYVVRNNKNKQKSADLLATINKKIKKLLSELHKYKNDNENVRLLLSRYDSKSLMENVVLDNTTYTVNKGHKLAVCLSTRDENEHLYDINNLIFVIIHELAHIGSKSYGHNEEFKQFFTFLLKKAIETGMYKYRNYSKNPVEYCGMEITSSPI